MRRITVSLDNDTSMKLDELSNGKTFSETIRTAISNFYDFKKSSRLDPIFINSISELLSRREHVIVDTGLWTAILEELNGNAGEDFWRTVAEVGREHGFLLSRKGIKEVYDVLKYFEMENWYRVKGISEKSYVLVLTVKAETKILCRFLENVFKALDKPVEIFEGNRKLIVIENLLDSESELMRKYLD